MEKLSAEIIEKAKAAESVEELLAIAKEKGIDMTANEAQTYFTQLNANSLDDDLLDGVAGGWIIFDEDARDPSNQRYKRGSNRKVQC